MSAIFNGLGLNAPLFIVLLFCHTLWGPDKTAHILQTKFIFVKQNCILIQILKKCSRSSVDDDPPLI